MLPYLKQYKALGNFRKLFIKNKISFKFYKTTVGFSKEYHLKDKINLKIVYLQYHRIEASKIYKNKRISKKIFK